MSKGDVMLEFSATRSAGAAVVGLVMLTSGCFVINVPTSSVGVPDPRPHLPKDLLENGDLNVMVIASAWRPARSEVSWIVESPVFIKAKDFQTLSKSVNARTKETPWLVGINIYTLIVPIPAGDAQWKTLDSLCIATADGRALRLDMNAVREWSPARKELILSARRDAMVVALQRPGTITLIEAEGPCSLAGTVEWAEADRARAIEFFQRMPERPTTWADTPPDPRVSQ